MSDSTELRWGPFCLKGRHGPLTRDDQVIKLQTRTLSVLWMLARQAGEIVAKSDLLDAVWPGMVVGESALSFQIQLLRRALDDDPRDPRYIQTVHRVGFRLYTDDRPIAASGPLFVGREAELAQLRSRLRLADSGQRQFVFVTGEAGIGKTALLNRLTVPTGAATALIVARGQCAEQGGMGEAFLPLLQALQQLVRESPDERVIQLLRRIAPSWLVQMPGLLDPAEYATLRRQTSGTPQARMLREMSEALEAIATDQTVLLLVEDLHWSDQATLQLLSRLAHQRDKARLMVLCTLRPSAAIISNHPVRRLQLDLRGHGLAHDLPLDTLSAQDVRHYLQQRLDAALTTPSLIAQVLERSDGHPLFMSQISDYLRNAAPRSHQDALTLSTSIPQGLRDLIELQASQLDPVQQQILDAAAVAGIEFAAAGVAAATGLAIETVERHCEALAQQEQFLTETGLATWPDGTLSGRYRFRHVLHQITLRERLASARRARSHRLLAERLENAYGTRSNEIAIDLALHCEAAGLTLKATHHRMLGARTALQRSAPAEALTQAQHGLHLLASLKSDRAHAELEIALHCVAASALMVQHSHAASDSQTHLQRIETLLDDAQQPALLESALSLLWLFHHMRGDFENALRYADRTQRLGQRLQNSILHCAGLAWGALSANSHGDFMQADQRSQQAIKIITGTMAQAHAGAIEPGCAALSGSALVRWTLGYPDLAIERAHQASLCTQNIGNPYTEAVTRTAVYTMLLMYRREYDRVLEVCEVAIPLYQQLSAYDALQWARVQHAMARCMTEGSDAALADLRNALDIQSRSGTPINMPFGYLCEAEFYLQRQRLTEAATAIEHAFEYIHRGVRTLESEALRLDGERLLLQYPSEPQRGEARLQAALDLARERRGLSFELRAATSLARHWHSQNRSADAHALLHGVYSRFTEGFETNDLREARALLDTLAPRNNTSSARTRRKR